MAFIHEYKIILMLIPGVDSFRIIGHEEHV